ncbi:MAG: RDD family protein [Bacilli bacterium]|nr:RDD family protein [Bacilli bacterium]
MSSKDEILNEDKNRDYQMSPLPKEEPTQEVVYNKKASIMNRIAGGLIDLGLLFMSIFGLSRLFLATPMTAPLRTYENKINTIIDDYKLTPLVEGSVETYSYKMYETDEQYSKNAKGKIIYYEEDINLHYVVVDNTNISKEVSNATSKALNADKNYKNLKFDYDLISYGYMMIAGFIAESVFLLVVPLVNKRRATIGKLAANTALVDSKYYVPARWYQVVGRFAWQFLIESALVYLFISSMILHLLIVPAVLFIITLFDRKKGRTLHDFISRTMVIEYKSMKSLGEQ